MMFTRDRCTGSAQFTSGTNDDAKLDHCKARFRTVLNGCQTDTIDRKFGGTLKDVCVEYKIEQQPESVKPFDNWYHDQGSFTCKKTEIPAGAGDGGALADTCTCWYSGYAGLTNVFKMPDSGDCKDTDKAALLTD